MWCLGLVAKDMVKLSKSNKLKFRSRILPYKKFNVELLQFGRYGPPKISVDDVYQYLKRWFARLYADGVEAERFPWTRVR